MMGVMRAITPALALVLAVAVVACSSGGGSRTPTRAAGDGGNATPTVIAEGTEVLSLSGATSAAGPHTIAIRYAAPSVDTSAAVDGNCWTSSIAAPARADAFRCMTGNVIHDPCFVAQDHGYVVCPGVPDDPKDDVVMKADVTQVPNDRPTVAGAPWYFIATSGARCGVLTGTVPETSIGITPYGCGDSGAAARAGCLPPAGGDPATVRCVGVRGGAEITEIVATEWF